MDKTVEITKEELAELLREFPTWGHAAVYYKRKLAQAERALRSIATVPPADLADVEERDYWKRQAVYCRRIASEALAAPDPDAADSGETTWTTTNTGTSR